MNSVCKSCILISVLFLCVSTTCTVLAFHGMYPFYIESGINENYPQILLIFSLALGVGAFPSFLFSLVFLAAMRGLECKKAWQWMLGGMILVPLAYTFHNGLAYTFERMTFAHWHRVPLGLMPLELVLVGPTLLVDLIGGTWRTMAVLTALGGMTALIIRPLHLKHLGTAKNIEI
jgi:hypothetical protein